MLIKHQSLTFSFDRPFPACVMVIGEDFFLTSQVIQSIKAAWRQKNDNDCDQKIIDIDNAGSWALLQDEAASYSLFASALVLEVRYDKKNLDEPGKAFLTHYLQSPNPAALVLFNAPHLNQKGLQTFIPQAQMLVIQTRRPDRGAIVRWIGNQLQQHCRFEPAIPELIEQYTRGNLLACSQLINKITLVHDAKKALTQAAVKEQLFNQCEFQVFELGDCCLSGNSEQAILMLRHLLQNRQETTLILWVITQEIRLLLRLKELMEKNVSSTAAIAQLKIWAQRTHLYLNAVKKQSVAGLRAMLAMCHQLDLAIKSSQTEQIYRSLELVVLSLTSGKSLPLQIR